MADNSRDNRGQGNDRLRTVEPPKARELTGDSRGAGGHLCSAKAKDGAERLPEACKGCPHEDRFPACGDSKRITNWLEDVTMIAVLSAQGLTSERDPKDTFRYNITPYPETSDIPCFGGAEVHCHSIEHGEIIVKVNRPLTSCSVPFLVDSVLQRDIHVVLESAESARLINYPDIVISPGTPFGKFFFVSANRIPLAFMKEAMQRVAAIAGYVSTAYILHDGEKPHLDEATNDHLVVPIPAELSVPDGVKVSATIQDGVAKAGVTANFPSAEQAEQMKALLFQFTHEQCLSMMMVSVLDSTVTVIASERAEYLPIVIHDIVRAANRIAENTK